VLRRHGPATAATLILAGLIAGLAVSAATPVRETHALPKVIRQVPPLVIVTAKPGDEVWFTWSGLNPRGSDRVLVSSAELMKMHPGLRVLRMRAANTKLGAGAPQRVFVGKLLDSPGFQLRALMPVTVARFEPGRAEQDWYFLAGVTAAKPGVYRLSGWRLHYTAGGLAGTTTYQQGIEIRVK
jgi:hypothetical protein